MPFSVRFTINKFTVHAKICVNILKIVKNDPLNKISRLLDFTDNPRDIADPWYTHNFDKTYDDIFEGCLSLLEHIKEKYDLN